ncbi:MAG: hypothetical protein Q7T97_17925 [Burkholderiaceae bacterium]|nr:hypothetical protein [Burkholderiaceae bacterium]
METPRIDELIAQVVAWHNRHGLARRITSAHVRSIGVVVLPFVSPDASDAPAKKPDKGLLPAFSEDFIPPLTAKQVSSFAVKNGSREHPGAASWSQKVVPVDAGHESAELALIYLRTASIELGDHRCRVLIGNGPLPKIIGPRAWSVPRIAGASAAATAVVVGGVMATLLIGTAEQPKVLVASASASAPASSAAIAARPAVASASAPAPASAPLPMPAAASAATTEKIHQAPVAASAASASKPSPVAPASVRAASAAVASAASMPLPASPTASAAVPKASIERSAAVDVPRERPPPVAIRPQLSSEVRAAALLEGKRLRATTPATKEVAAAPDTGRVYAVMTVSTRTRAMAERGHLLMESSASVGELPGKPRSELMKVAGGWRAVLWPFSNRDDAKVAQAMLSERGVRTEVLEF